MATSQTVKPYYDPAKGKKQEVADMFNNISGTYDFLNHFLSFGIDHFWRRRAILALKPHRPQYLLDVATGTGDFALEALERLHPEKVIGVDIAEGMLNIAREKVKKKGLEERFKFMLGDSEALPFADGTFDAVTVAFGVRNFENLEQGLAEICRVLKPGGRAVVLEFSKPRAFPIKQLYGFYAHQILPRVGRLFSKDSRAYEYLPESVDQFPDGQQFCRILQQAGFRETVARPQTFGICTIYLGTK